MNGNDFAALLERSIERSGKTAEVKQIELAPALPRNGNDERVCDLARSQDGA